jgi:hypothetical protein
LQRLPPQSLQPYNPSVDGDSTVPPYRQNKLTILHGVSITEGLHTNHHRRAKLKYRTLLFIICEREKNLHTEELGYLHKYFQ